MYLVFPGRPLFGGNLVYNIICNLSKQKIVTQHIYIYICVVQVITQFNFFSQILVHSESNVTDNGVTWSN